MKVDALTVCDRTCQGMQLLTILTSGNWSVLDRHAFDSENISWALDLTAAAQ